jgi:hypothetical protein
MPSIHAALEWLAALGWTTALRESTTGAAMLQTGHVASTVVFAGLVMMMDLRLVGLAFTNAPSAQIQRRLFPWQMAGFVPAIATGLILFCADPLRYYVNTLFWVKLALLALAGVNAIAFHLKTYRTADRWDEDPSGTTMAHRAGAISLALWAAIIVAGRLIPNDWFNFS